MPPASFRWLTAEEWDTSGHLWLMLHNATEKTGDQRKIGLFGAACCRQYWDYLLPESQVILAEFEALLDRLPSPSERDICAASGPLGDRANAAVRLVVQAWFPGKFRVAAAKAVCYAVIGSAFGAYGYFREVDSGAEATFIQLLRDIFGNPFRPVVGGLAWRDTNVQALAHAIYDESDFELLPVLADALEDAGETNAELLGHCREAHEHVQGCWALDFLLARK